jgi:3,4-dihydroxy 2-butanone 4-phosphate synthase/GTP cyclohydrolase II
MTNNPDKVAALEDYGLTVTERVALEAVPRSANRGYLETKRTRFGHLLSLINENGNDQIPALARADPEKKKN